MRGKQIAIYGKTLQLKEGEMKLVVNSGYPSDLLD